MTKLSIQQIELDEFDDIPFLIATIAWDDSSMCTLSEAVQTFERTFDQVIILGCCFLCPQIYYSRILLESNV